LVEARSSTRFSDGTVEGAGLSFSEVVKQKESDTCTILTLVYVLKRVEKNWYLCRIRRRLRLGSADRPAGMVSHYDWIKICDMDETWGLNLEEKTSSRSQA